ncbi:MAG: hypothetical protein KIT84_09425 [Labilithrix sp.]|nr:hypothetical protein [Labilithrix sp.]MCW5811221.1 hypothetical protein [Labilithrix sp.]
MTRALFAGAALLAACSLTIDTGDLTGGPAASSPAPDAGDAGPPSLDDAGPIPDGASPPVCDLPTDSDPKNCGACGRDCLGGACTNGTCGVSVIARDFDGPLGVSVAGGKVYVGHAGGLVELDLDGTNRRTVVADLHATYVHATETDVFFAEGTTSSIRRWPRSGGSAALVVGAPNILGVALSPTHLYYTRYTSPNAGGGVYRMTYPNTGGPELLFSYDRAEEIDWLDGRIYVGSDGESDAVIAVNDDGTGERTTLLEGGGPVAVSVLGADAFIARQGGEEVLRVPIAGGAPESLVKSPDQSRPSGIAAVAGAIYWVEVDSGELDVLVY